MKFLEDPYQTLGAGFALAVGLIIVYLGIAGVNAGDADWFGMIVRWIHFLAGITWIGLLYFFNLINAGFLKSLDGPTKKHRHPKTDADCLKLVPSWRHRDRSRGSRALRLSLFEGRNGSHCVRDRRSAWYHHDGKCSWGDLAQSEKGHCGSRCCSPGHACSSGDGAVGKNGVTGVEN